MNHDETGVGEPTKQMAAETLARLRWSSDPDADTVIDRPRFEPPVERRPARRPIAVLGVALLCAWMAFFMRSPEQGTTESS